MKECCNTCVYFRKWKGKQQGDCIRPTDRKYLRENISRVVWINNRCRQWKMADWIASLERKKL